MSFFNKKEDVIDLKLTPWGRQSLSLGRLDPYYYAFFDDDILYDGSYAMQHDEDQNNIEPRIKEVPRAHTQHIRTGISDYWGQDPVFVSTYTIKVMGYEMSHHIHDWVHVFSPRDEKEEVLSFPLGTSEINSPYAPSWDIKFHDNAITSVSSSLKLHGNPSNASGHPEAAAIDKIIPIPQINAQSIYKTKVKAGAASMALSGLADDFISVEESDIMIKIEEKNTEFFLENFEIEFFLVEKTFPEDPATPFDPGMIRETLTPLTFDYSSQTLQYDMASIISPTKHDISYYFDITVDEEIDGKLLCNHFLDKAEELLFDNTFECIEKDGLLTYDIYGDGPDSTAGSENNSGEAC